MGLWTFSFNIVVSSSFREHLVSLWNFCHAVRLHRGITISMSLLSSLLRFLPFYIAWWYFNDLDIFGKFFTISRYNSLVEVLMVIISLLIITASLLYPGNSWFSHMKVMGLFPTSYSNSSALWLNDIKTNKWLVCSVCTKIKVI